MSKSKGAKGPIIIKKYANRRLYDTSSSTYVTLDHLANLVTEERDFEVRDAKTNEDLTRQVLTQIIFERETKGEGALPLNFLRKLIRFYGGGAQPLLPAYLDMTMNSFSDAQREWRKAANPMNLFEKQARRNMAMFEQAMRLFTPTRNKSNSADQPADTSPLMDMQAQALDEMREQMAMMQEKLEELTRKS